MYACVRVRTNIHSHTSVMNGPDAKFNKIFIEQLSIKYIREIWFPNREHSKVYNAEPKYVYIQGVPGGMCQTSGGCSLC